jgi:hypothetical protein
VAALLICMLVLPSASVAVAAGGRAPVSATASAHKKHKKLRLCAKHGSKVKCRCRSGKVRKRSHGRYRCVKRRHHQPGPQPASDEWISLPGSVMTYTDDVILTRDSFLDSAGGGENPPVYYLTGTRSGPFISIDGRNGVPSGTDVQGEGQLLTPPVPGHPRGLAILVVRVTTPPSGIDPARTQEYFSVFDAASGDHLLTSAPFDPNAIEYLPVAYEGGALRSAGCGRYSTVDQAGHVSYVPFPGHGTQSGTESCAATTPVDGKILIEGYDQAPDACPTVYVSDVVTQTTISKSPCLRQVSVTSGWFFDGSAYGVRDTPVVFSAADGSRLTSDHEFDIDQDQAVFLNGIRSGLTLVYPDSAGYGSSYFVSSSSWQPVFVATPDQAFTPYGIADGYAWVDASGGRVVIDARTGSTVAAHWRIYPFAGGAGWTLASESDVCCDREYLLRSDGTMLSALDTAPTP